MCRVWSNLLTSWGRQEDEAGKEGGELQEARFPGWEPGRDSRSSLGSLGHTCSSRSLTWSQTPAATPGRAGKQRGDGK